MYKTLSKIRPGLHQVQVAYTMEGLRSKEEEKLKACSPIEGDMIYGSGPL